MRFGIRYVELILDQPPNAATRPDRVGVTEPGRASFEEAFEFGELLVVEFRRPTGPWLRRKGFDALFVENFSPKLNSRKTTAGNRDDLVIAKSLLDQPSTLNPAVL